MPEPSFYTSHVILLFKTPEGTPSLQKQSPVSLVKHIKVLGVLAPSHTPTSGLTPPPWDVHSINTKDLHLPLIHVGLLSPKALPDPGTVPQHCYLRLKFQPKLPLLPAACLALLLWFPLGPYAPLCFIPVTKQDPMMPPPGKPLPQVLCCSSFLKYLDKSIWCTFPELFSVQSSSVTQSCPTLCDPMNCSTPGLPVYHQLPEFTQTHVHWVGDAIQPSHPLSSPSPPAPNPSQYQSLYRC